MPDILVEVKGDWLGERKTDFLEAIHAALVEALHTPSDDKIVRLIDHPRDHFIVPAGMSEKFTRIAIEMFVGRSIDAKRALYKAIVRAIISFGVPPNDIKIVLIEVPKENVGFRGGQAACDVDLGYSVSV
jgi:phenylpyruvate tautomerase PptA (4-oxalocrotonate tautomerase family)